MDVERFRILIILAIDMIQRQIIIYNLLLLNLSEFTSSATLSKA